MVGDRIAHLGGLVSLYEGPATILKILHSPDGKKWAEAKFHDGVRNIDLRDYFRPHWVDEDDKPVPVDERGNPIGDRGCA